MHTNISFISSTPFYSQCGLIPRPSGRGGLFSKNLSIYIYRQILLNDFVKPCKHRGRASAFTVSEERQVCSPITLYLKAVGTALRHPALGKCLTKVSDTSTSLPQLHLEAIATGNLFYGNTTATSPVVLETAPGNFLDTIFVFL
jgi:hypothetical protein